jgi:hypothetical protein
VNKGYAFGLTATNLDTALREIAGDTPATAHPHNADGQPRDSDSINASWRLCLGGANDHNP